MSDGIPANARGKWSQLGVPHKGWFCVDQEDLKQEEKEYETCEMCESQTIRFVHVMSHSSYPHPLRCGCDCAGHMEGSKQRAEERLADMQRKAARRKNFPKRKGWKISKSGSPYINVDGYHCVIGQRGDQYVIGIKPPLSDRYTWGQKRFSNLRQAKEKCFDAILFMKSQAPHYG